MSIETLLSAIAPQFDALDTTIRDALITSAAKQCSPTTWAELYEEGVANLAAHLMTLRAQALVNDSIGVAAVAGSVSSIKTGGLALSFGGAGAAAAGGSEAALRTTPYGLEYLRLRSMIVTSPYVNGGTI